MSVQDKSVDKLDVQEAKKASYGVDAEVADPTGVSAAVPGGSAQQGEVSGPMTQGSGIKPYTKVGMINSMIGALSGMKKAEVSAMYDKFKGDKTNPMQGSSVNPKGRVAESKIARITAEDIDIAEDVNAIFAGVEVSDEFIAKAKEVFEAAVLSKVNEQIDNLDEKFDASLTEEISTVSEGLVERVDSYLDYVVEQWMENNAVAIERGLKSEIVESFMSGLKGLFEEHYIDIPDEAVAVTEELADQVEFLEAAINEEIEKNVELSAQLKEFERAIAFNEVSEGLTDTQYAKLQSLSESVDFESVDTYKKKIGTLRESYFPSKSSAGTLSESVTLDEEPVGDDVTEKQVPVEMAAYMNAISRGIKK
jgi:hypothetical protein